MFKLFFSELPSPVCPFPPPVLSPSTSVSYPRTRQGDMAMRDPAAAIMTDGHWNVSEDVRNLWKRRVSDSDANVSNKKEREEMINRRIL